MTVLLVSKCRICRRSQTVLYFIDQRNLFGRGLSWVDCQLLASAAVSNLHISNLHMMTNDRMMKAVAKELRLLA